jgi:alkanesulfonate monooxygenase SsuD/methylene tetrahydromethanopterin reductase-like flavin-dependent oxidoreductase (luciferase family)
MMNPSFGVTVSGGGPGSDPVAMAIEAERLGFDFVSASDHPGATAANLETWTMLTWIAARTTRIGVATKVLGVPFRSPAITAKMAATLDDLSSGRLILGLGGGHDDQEIASLGLHAGTPGERIQGLEEAIAIIRGLWTESTSSYDGQHYHVCCAHLEPKPTRSIPIWLGTFGNRALAVTGRLANGWIPSLGYAPPQAIPGMHERIFTSARAAGRDPAEITCAYHMEIHVGHVRDARASLVSGSPDEVIARLESFTRLGFTAMNFTIVGADWPQQLELLAHDVLPAVRQARSSPPMPTTRPPTGR